MNLGKLSPVRCLECGSSHKEGEPHFLELIQQAEQEARDNIKRFRLGMPQQNEKYLAMVGRVLSICNQKTLTDIALPSTEFDLKNIPLGEYLEDIKDR